MTEPRSYIPTNLTPEDAKKVKEAQFTNRGQGFHPYSRVGNYCWYCAEDSGHPIHRVTERRSGQDRRR